MTMTAPVEESLVRSLRAEIADELARSVRALAADGRHLDLADEEMLARQLTAQRLESLALSLIHI